MEKRNLTLMIISLFSILIVGCSGSSSSSSVPEIDDSSSEPQKPQITLKEDKRENYEIDTNVSNKDGSVAYEIFVRSFYDTDNNGIGDLNGVAVKLPYIASLGVKTIWLMPINPSPSYHGYDVKDYYAINSDYGTMTDFDNLIKEAKKYNIDIMMDMVLNHSSKQNPWFEQSYQDKINNNHNSDSKADWYHWDKTFGHSYKDLCYEGDFSSEMPDFNWESVTFRKEVDNICKFWVNKGVKGFRLDAVKHFTPSLKKNIDALNYIKDCAIKYDPEFYMVGECWTSNGEIVSYASSKCDSFFKFSSSLSSPGSESVFGLISLIDNAKSFSMAIEDAEAQLKAKNPSTYYSYFLDNHDMDRTGNYFREENQAKAAASIMGLMPGYTYMYYGDEILMKGKRKKSPDDYSDARRRLPMVWSETNKKGECKFPEPSRQDLADNAQVSKGADDLSEIPYSLLNHYRKVMNIRNKYPIFKNGIYKDLVKTVNCSEDKLLAYQISDDNEKIVIITNASKRTCEVNVAGLGSKIDSEINTVRLLPELNNGSLKIGPYSTVILK